MEPEHFVGKIAQKVIIEKDGTLLLVRNAFDKSIGVWDLPGGRLHLDEQPIEGVTREIKEELGVDIVVHKIVYVDQHRKTKNNELTVMLAYAAELADPAQALTLDPIEVEEVVWIKPSELDSYKTFSNIDRALRVYFKDAV
jgi:ADP-ribose pyrophosphatase YjhB (NUDIX family)